MNGQVHQHTLSGGSSGTGPQRPELIGHQSLSEGFHRGGEKFGGLDEGQQSFPQLRTGQRHTCRVKRQIFMFRES